MSGLQLYLVSHLLSVVTFALAALLAVRLLTSRGRTSQSLLAWLLGLAFAPLLAIPLYLLFGARKFPRRVEAKRTPRIAEGPARSALEGRDAAQVPLVLRTQGVPPVREGNAFELLPDGERAYARLLTLIGSAQRSVDLTMFILGTDEVGDAVVSALAERARSGVRVRLLLDAVGSVASRRRAGEILTAAGGEVRSFMPLLHAPLRGRSNLRSHRKIAVADGTHTFLGGMNLALEYMGPTRLADRWRDLAAVVEGPLSADAEELFEADWTFAGGPSAQALPPPRDAALPHDRLASNDRAPAPGKLLSPDAAPLDTPRPAGTAALQLVPSGPEMKSDTFYDAVLTALFAARRSVAIVTPYYVPDDALQHAMVLCARRGVRTQLVVPARSNHPLADFARRGLLRELQSAGVELLYSPQMVHGKAMVVDDGFGYLGSPNLDMRSFFLNYEVALLLHSEAEVAQLRRWIDALAAECAPTIPAPGRPFWFLEQIARLVAPEL